MPKFNIQLAISKFWIVYNWVFACFRFLYAYTITFQGTGPIEYFGDGNPVMTYDLIVPAKWVVDG